jgi:hypothetical protein
MADETEINPAELSGDAQDPPEEVDEEYPAEVDDEEHRRAAGEETEPPAKAKPSAAKPPTKEGEKPAKKPPAERKPLRLKVNGKETEIPPEEAEHIERTAKALGVDVETLLRGPQMLRAGQERLRQAAEVEKRAKAVLDGLGKDGKAALRTAGLSPQQVAELGVAIVQDLIEAEQLTPEQRRIRDLEGKIKADEEAKREVEEKAKAEEAQVYQAKVADKVAAQITAALEAGKLPRDPYTVKRLASLMQDHLAKGGDADDLDIADFIPLVTESMRKEHAAFLGGLSGEQVAKLYPEMAEKVRKYYADRARGRSSIPAKQPQRNGSDEAPEKRERKIMSTNDVLRNFVTGR